MTDEVAKTTSVAVANVVGEIDQRIAAVKGGIFSGGVVLRVARRL